ncbi:hypothetical protein FCK90_01510 [Kocuria coralli]|uniref:DUF4386 family protein n=1 Tax=Kocuria coralli TaxID=1461025 RepID=A0A5J5L3N5_9MICC|nr:hypothetical protein [Kocuria coralli]KAA9395706.1 hypothetical protein FCK90_01510 [Kocuria coralli]
MAAPRAFRGLMLAGSILTGISLLLLSLLPDAPSDPAALADWVERGSALLMWSDELLFFAVICWWAGAWGVFGSPGATRSVRTTIGMTALALALISLVVVLLAVGRLVYPVFELELSTESLALVLSSTFGALHLAFLGFTVAAVTLSWETRLGTMGRILGIIAAIVFLSGSFPWLTSTWWNSLVAVVLAAWGGFISLSAEASSNEPEGTS